MWEPVVSSWDCMFCFSNKVNIVQDVYQQNDEGPFLLFDTANFHSGNYIMWNDWEGGKVKNVECTCCAETIKEELMMITSDIRWTHHNICPLFDRLLTLGSAKSNVCAL